MLTPLLLVAAAQATAATAEFRPDLFFAGPTRGTGTVKTLTAAQPRSLQVSSVGRIEPDGTLVLDQDIRLGGKPQQRTFRIRRSADGDWIGTLSDASGPVSASVRGPTLSLAYPMKRGGMRMNQTLTLQPGGRTLLNRARVTLLGVTVARIEETIEKVD
ncbi:MAG TPA: DUF3833 family protein [Sphingomonadaceae bacterium]|nr:DUF3833 family protein [Sphingomonadaceae bacterium]